MEKIYCYSFLFLSGSSSALSVSVFPSSARRANSAVLHSVHPITVKVINGHIFIVVRPAYEQSQPFKARSAPLEGALDSGRQVQNTTTTRRRKKNNQKRKK
jgi:hypothetical protein